ncbi:hypothetical protein TNCV_781921 [Trichonephila clavipes]|nr:hypothetical protein TNCV_781921 [Trichonephila clavipes]
MDILVMIEDGEWPRTKQTFIFEEGMLIAGDQNPGTSVRVLAVATGRSQTTVHRLQDETLHRFYVKRVQLLQPDDLPRSVAFAQCFVNQSAADMHFASSLLYCEEAVLPRERVFNTHNANLWALNSPLSTQPRAT